MNGFDEKAYQAQQDARTLMESHAIRKDSKRHQAAIDHAKKKMDEMMSVASEQPNSAGAKK